MGNTQPTNNPRQNFSVVRNTQGHDCILPLDGNHINLFDVLDLYSKERLRFINALPDDTLHFLASDAGVAMLQQEVIDRNAMISQSPASIKRKRGLTWKYVLYCPCMSPDTP